MIGDRPVAARDHVCRLRRGGGHRRCADGDQRVLWSLDD